MGRKILIVDDEPDARHTLQCVLSPLAEILTAADGPQALAAIAAFKPDLMLLDMEMPEMSGLEVLETGLKAAPAMSVVMLTAQSDISVAKEALEKGARAYITKPIDPSRLREEIRDILGLNTSPDDPERKAPWRVVT